MKPLENKIVLLGAGNVATHLGIALQERQFPIIQVYSRTLISAKNLGKKLQTAYTNQIRELIPDAGIYIFALQDAALPELLAHLPPLPGLWVHTSGCLSLEVFAAYSERSGVLYPLQTFSKTREVFFQSIPLFIEAKRPEDEILLEEIAATLSDKVIHLSSEKRKRLHLAAVFACNFTNHLYALASGMLEEEGLSRSLLLPLIQETASKVIEMHPREAQTGPAIRKDEIVMIKHLEMLNRDACLQELYRLLSASIHKAPSPAGQGEDGALL
jgi:predicted short-subunit dehydrogenase-like oxidoreductase (DUF2520 family)